MFVGPQVEQAIYDAFIQEDFVSKFLSYLSLEDRKGHDKFDFRRFLLFKVSSFAASVRVSCSVRCRYSAGPKFGANMLEVSMSVSNKECKSLLFNETRLIEVQVRKIKLDSNQEGVCSFWSLTGII